MSVSAEKKSGFANLHESVKAMILNASAPTDEVTPVAPCTSCEEFL